MIRGDKARLDRTIQELARIGGSSEGMNRFAYTEEEREALHWLKAEFGALGLAVREDAVGNVFARYEGSEAGLKPILAGSHIDTVRNGGKYDGALGVLSLLEILRRFREEGILLRHPLDLVICKGEEGTRFGATLLGSAAMTGRLTEDDLQRRDQDGISLKEAMAAHGYDPSAFPSATLKPGSIAAYLELHIEQARVLETEQLPIGIVTGIAGPLWLEVTVSGEAGHAGATPMRIRHDPMPAAAELLLETERIAKKFQDTVATTGQIKAIPGSTNVIPASVTFTIDVRDVDIQDRDEAEARIREAARHISRERGVTIELNDLSRIAPVTCSEVIMAVLEEAAAGLELKYRRMPSGAGHDAMNLAKLCPIGMLFVPSRNGLSHRPDEYTSPEDGIAGTDVLLQAIRLLDERLDRPS